MVTAAAAVMHTAAAAVMHTALRVSEINSSRRPYQHLGHKKANRLRQKNSDSEQKNKNSNSDENGI